MFLPSRWSRRRAGVSRYGGAPESIPVEIVAYFDRFEDGQFRGWACNLHNHGETVEIELYADGKLVKQVSANFERPDVNSAGILGAHGFDFVLPTLRVRHMGQLEMWAVCRDARKKIPISQIEQQIIDFYVESSAPLQLNEVSASWGACATRGSLSCMTYKDVVYVPFKPFSFIDTDHGWGLYASDGTLIANGAYRRGADHKLVGQSARRQITDLEVDEAPFETMVYGGPIIPHYGHFLLSSLSRCWAIDGSMPVLFHSSPNIRDHRAPYIVHLLAAAGLSGCSYSFDRPTRIKRVTVPEPAFQEQYSVARDYAVSMSAIGRNIVAIDLPRARKIYLSKSRLVSGVTGLIGEIFVDHKMHAAGFTVVHPETLTLAEQVELFRRAEIVVGVAGSAFHTLALTPYAGVTCLVLTLEEFVNSNFRLIDKFSKTNMKYLSISEQIHRSEDGKFNISYAAKNLNHLADSIIAATQTYVSL